MRKRISMPDRDFMKAAKSAAKSGQSLRATALGAGVSLQTYKNHLMDVAMRLQEAPPNFPKGRRTRMKEHISEIRSSGQGGQGRRLALPNEIFAIMGWDVGMKVKIKKSGKKVTIETYHGSESGYVEDED